ncbi:hypothetical protein [Burkholderia phage FLC9]|nr:hypothetical protein [Burkholderia phage FLC9]
MSTVGMVRGKTARPNKLQSNGGGVPGVFTPEQFEKNNWQTHTSIDNVHWVPARPMGWQGFCLLKRLKIAWKVFKGEYDALKWPF